MNISDVIKELEKLAPLSLQESYDNSGLLVGNEDLKTNGALICLDSIEEVIDEAINKSINLVISHHPILFSGLKSITGKNYVERVIAKAIKNDIAIYAIHTNLDNIKNGVNKKIGELIGLKNLKILDPKKGLLKKLVFFAPTENSEKIKDSIFKAGGGKIGEYDYCSYTSEGIGSFRASMNSNPYAGEKGKIHRENELRVEIVLPNYLEKNIIRELLLAHPYEEVAYDIYSLENSWNEVGSGMIGELEEPIPLLDFLDQIKVKLNTACIRHTKEISKTVKKIAICGGSGSFLLNKAIAEKADVLVTSDFKYHQFFDTNEKIVIADVGHFESEQFTTSLIQDYLQEKIPNFATYLSKVNTNPINYR